MFTAFIFVYSTQYVYSIYVLRQLLKHKTPALQPTSHPPTYLYPPIPTFTYLRTPSFLRRCSEANYN